MNNQKIIILNVPNKKEFIKEYNKNIISDELKKLAQKAGDLFKMK